MKATYAIGVDMGGTKMAAGLVERRGRIVKEARALTPKGGAFGVIDQLIDLIVQVSADMHGADIAGIGIGLPAQVDFFRQTVEFATNVPLSGLDVRALIMSRLKHPVTIDNDVHTAALGEFRYGAAQGARDWVMITVGTGVGGGMFIEGRPYRGFRGMGGEIGHMVVELDGRPCPCGGRGHLEAYIARPAIASAGRQLATQFKGVALRERAGGDPEAVTAEHVIVGAREGDPACQAIIADAAGVLGHHLVGIVNLLNPQLVVIGGGVAEGQQVFADTATKMIADEALAGRADVSVALAELGNDAGVLGAAALAFDEYDSRESLHR
jgi:glucokinase